MLRDLWQLSRYINVRKIQGSVQNIDRVNQQLSDAPLHTHDYCVAITLMSTPLFFQQTVYAPVDGMIALPDAPGLGIELDRAP